MINRNFFAFIAAILLIPAAADASFHVIEIESLMNRFGPSEEIEYVELEMLAPGQTQVRNTRLTFFSGDGSVVTVLDVADENVASGSSGSSILFATSTFGVGSGVIPDFFFEPGTIDDSGMICWGAPGGSPPDPSTWDPAVPNSYIDCVAFGGYTGPLPGGKSGVSSSAPGDGQNALNRVNSTGDDSVDFELGLPRPCNNAGECAVLTTPTTITSTTVPATITSTTSSTMPLDRECCGDVDGNGSVKASDALAVLRKAVGLDVTFQCQNVCFSR
ncbi:MAG: hypothetical protein ACI8TX_002431 [Hyphomicrobiaceae bacterium]|jgi:hypothetical protein